MPKSKQQKVSTVGTLAGDLKAGMGVVFANFQGLTVAAMEDLRKQCRAEGVTITAAKKTLVKRACDEAGLGDIDPKSWVGGIATAVGKTDEVAPAKILATFAKTHEQVVIYGGVLEHKFITAAAVKHLSALPSKQQLLGQLVGTLNAPVSGFVNVLAGNLRNLVGVLNNIKEAKI